MEKRFADLHCHPHMRSFNWFRGTRIEKKSLDFHPWHIVVSDKKKADDSKRAAAYSQSDLIKLWNGNVKLVFAALYPMEQGWFINNDMVWREALKIILHPRKNKDIYWAAWGALFRKNTNRVSFMQKILEPLYMMIPNHRIRFFRKRSYRYFDEVKQEHTFVMSKSGVASTSKLFPGVFEEIIEEDPSLKPFFKASGTYQVARNGREVVEAIDQGNVAFVLTMEGANIFDSKDEVERVVDRINELKSGDSFPVFFVTLAHHFFNDLCGHAHSIPDEGAFFINQTQGMLDGITGKGRKVIRILLSLNEALQYDPVLGRRILIDVKHMNALSRKQYYHDYIVPCMTNGDTIPVIASHCAYSGVLELDQLIEGMKNENGHSHRVVDGESFNCWNINLCDEEIRLIFETGGIIGLNFDQRVLGVRGDAKKQSDHFKFLWANLRCMANVILNASSLKRNPAEVWDLFCLGTDFDGYIDPANGYSTALNFEKFHDRLCQTLQMPENSRYLVNGLTAVEIANKVCFDNAYTFVKTYF